MGHSGVMESCPKCGSEHKTEQSLKIHYGRAHEGSIAGEKIECHNCGDKFRVKPNRLERDSDRYFCSYECQGETYSKKEKLTCEQCGDDFERVKSRVEGVENHYCSTECKGKSYRDRIEVECASCGKQFERGRAFIERENRHYCGNECRKEHMRGAAHPRYQGGDGVDTAIRRMLGDDSWRVKSAEMRDENPDAECKMCGADSSANGRALHLHHIVPVMAGGVHSDELLMWLCHSCHHDVEEYTRSILEYPIVELVKQHGGSKNENHMLQQYV